jgi:hypothetical protein
MCRIGEQKIYGPPSEKIAREALFPRLRASLRPEKPAIEDLDLLTLSGDKKRVKNPTRFLCIFLVLSGASQAAILVQDDFSTSGALNGSTPDVSITGGKWIANPGYSSDGSTVTKIAGNIGAGVALGGTLASGGTYNISATISFNASGAAGTSVWGFGLSQNTTTGSALTGTDGSGGSPWIFIRENGAIEFRPLPSNNSTGSIIVVAAPGGTPATSAVVYNLRLSISTVGATWVVSGFLSTNGGGETQLDLNGLSTTGLTYTYATNPTVGYVGITSTANAGIGSLDNLLMEGPLPVPEPSAALLGAIGALGICSLRRRHA